MGRRLDHGVKFIVNQAYIHGGSSVKSGSVPEDETLSVGHTGHLRKVGYYTQRQLKLTVLRTKGQNTGEWRNICFYASWVYGEISRKLNNCRLRYGVP
ncbi:hypothetical protein AVEN_233169-1 [Araneus ventricosus]|uniref:Uncharacterized protein n=1 Tax=Araneus ventricosus TaxID=182803 RepID=A0A4Y2EGL9_ARAVE|nr:hypothetical protein AVEN_233169-1 [Araneus ventricosus]